MISQPPPFNDLAFRLKADTLRRQVLKGHKLTQAEWLFLVVMGAREELGSVGGAAKTTATIQN